MTPASLRMNYIQELKKCGDLLYKMNQFWEFIPSGENDRLAVAFAKVLSLPTSFIKKQGGAWFVNLKRKANYAKLNAKMRAKIDEQVTKMLSNKYQFINYNGLRKSHLPQLQKKLGQPNIFDHAVVIIDEVHNFVSRIVNKLKQKKSLSMRLYDYLKRAKNCRIICLTGTPIINYPNEIGILFNILRGYIVTYTLPLTIATRTKINEQKMRQILQEVSSLDYVQYQSSLKQLTITRNPFGFVNVGDGEKTRDERGNIDDGVFLSNVIASLQKHKISVHKQQIKTELHPALPDTLESFTKWFLDEKTGVLKNQNIFKKRILGLVSHFRSPQEELMPRYEKNLNFHIVKIPMSDYQLNIYEQAREGERKLEMEQAKRRRKKTADGENVYEDSVSTYRIFSRAFCNFVFPGEIRRPFPRENLDLTAGTQLDEDILDNATVEEKIQNIDGRFTEDDAAALSSDTAVDRTYEQRIQKAIEELTKNKEEYLSKDGLKQLSPKFLSILTNIETHEGLHLIYSQFRTLEGIGIFSLVLEANGFSQLKIRKTAQGGWQIIGDLTKKPRYILYTGTESVEEKEIMRNIFNSTWDSVPRSIKNQLQRWGENNFHGEIARVFMITAAGAEGISLKNVRNVHIMEPYWHPVRIEQVIGRARRICSHQALPEPERSVDVYLYLMTFSPHQIADLVSIELKIKDLSKLDKQTPLTSDEALYEISTIKENINRQLLKAIKESAIDCAVQMRAGDDDQVCFSFSDPKPEQFAYTPSLTGGDDDDIQRVNVREKRIKIKLFTYGEKRYAYNKQKNEVYDYESYLIAKKNKSVQPIIVGKLVTTREGKRTIQFK